MKQNIILLLCLSFGLFSCYDDKGNYDYREIDELTITGMPEEPVTALSKAENLVVRPTVTSKFDGEISADDPNYELPTIIISRRAAISWSRACWIPPW